MSWSSAFGLEGGYGVHSNEEKETMKDDVRPALLTYVLLTLLTGVVYPLLVTLIAQTAFSFQANGSIVMRHGKPVGSELVGQPFDDPRYFWSRPSATAP